MNEKFAFVVVQSEWFNEIEACRFCIHFYCNALKTSNLFNFLLVYNNFQVHRNDASAAAGELSSDGVDSTIFYRALVPVAEKLDLGYMGFICANPR